MKKNLNVIQIKGFRGLFLAGFIVCCLVAGFVVFPGWLAMQIWNLISASTSAMPAIGLIQGVLLWGILAVSYLVFCKEKVVVCMKTPQGLSEEELKTVFADMKRQTLEDPILQAMMKAREAELKYKAQQELEKKEIDQTSDIDSKKI